MSEPVTTKDTDGESLDLHGVAVILDTNELDQTGLLKDPITISLLFYLRQLDGVLVLPEIVKQEWARHWQDHARKQYKSFQQAGNWLRGHFDGISVTPLGIDAAAEVAFEARLTQLGDLLAEEPVAEDDWREAGQMVIEKHPPSGEKNQQFKDSLLWRAALRVGKEHAVVLVSGDKGFASAQGDLHESLAEQAREEGSEVWLVQSREVLLLKMHDELDTYVESLEGIWEEVQQSFLYAVNDVLIDRGMRTGWNIGWSSDTYATSDPKTVTVLIELNGQLEEVADPDADMPWYVYATGSCLVNTHTGSVNTVLTSVVFEVSTSHGEHRSHLVRHKDPVRVNPGARLELDFWK